MAMGRKPAARLPPSSRRTAVGLRADRRQWRGHGDDQPAGIRPGRADRIADDPGGRARRRLEQVRAGTVASDRPASIRCTASISPAAPVRSRTVLAVSRARRARPSHAVAAAAARWKVDVATLPRGAGTCLGPGGRKLGYGELAEAAMALPVPEKVALKNPTDFSIIGRPTPRLDARGQEQRATGFWHRRSAPEQLRPSWRVRRCSARDLPHGRRRGARRQGRQGRDARAAGSRRRRRGSRGRRLWQATQGRDALELAVGPAKVEKVDSERRLARYRELAGRPGPRKFEADMAPLEPRPGNWKRSSYFPTWRTRRWSR